MFKQAPGLRFLAGLIATQYYGVHSQIDPDTLEITAAAPTGMEVIEILTPVSIAPALITPGPKLSGTNSSCVPYQCNLFYQVCSKVLRS